jgi:hypothetical protein
MSIGEFAKRSQLSPKALRLYDKLGLLRPARVDADSAYRFYEQPNSSEHALYPRCVNCRFHPPISKPSSTSSQGCRRAHQRVLGGCRD